MQPRYNLLFREIENELLPLCRYHGIGVIPFNPLAGGFLSGKYKPGTEPPKDARFGFLQGEREESITAATGMRPSSKRSRSCGEFFTQRNKSLVQAAIAWVLAQPDVTSAIVGASSAGQLRESLPATEVSLDAEEMEACNDVWFDLPRLRDPEVALR